MVGAGGIPSEGAAMNVNLTPELENPVHGKVNPTSAPPLTGGIGFRRVSIHAAIQLLRFQSWGFESAKIVTTNRINNLPPVSIQYR